MEHSTDRAQNYGRQLQRGAFRVLDCWDKFDFAILQPASFSACNVLKHLRSHFSIQFASHCNYPVRIFFFWFMLGLNSNLPDIGLSDPCSFSSNSVPSSPSRCIDRALQHCDCFTWFHVLEVWFACRFLPGLLICDFFSWSVSFRIAKVSSSGAFCPNSYLPVFWSSITSTSRLMTWFVAFLLYLLTIEFVALLLNTRVAIPSARLFLQYFVEILMLSWEHLRTTIVLYSFE